VVAGFGRHSGRPYGLSLYQKLQRVLHDPLRGDIELFIQDLVRGRGAEMIEAHHVSFLADIAPPTLGSPRLYGNPGFDLGREDVTAVGLGLLVKQLPGRHTHKTG
jgi:hypothetical protein